MKYVMTLTEEQYMHIANCVETCHRIACGQIDEISSVLPKRPSNEIVSRLKEECFPELCWAESYGWNGGYRGTEHGEKFREAFDKFQAQGYQIYREMYHKRNIAEGINNVLSSPTLTTDKAEQPIIEVIKE